MQLPSVPLNMTVSVQSPLAIFVSWNLPGDTGLGPSVTPSRVLTDFLLDMLALPASSAILDFGSASSYLLGGFSTSFSVSGLVKGYFYYFRLRAQNSAGSGNWTSVLFERGVDIPFGVQSIAARCVSPLSINVSWVAPIDTGLGLGQPSRLFLNGGYLIEIANSTAFVSPTNIFISGNVTSWRLSGLIKGQLYFFRICSRNSAGILCYFQFPC